jgi:hypothetical protein
MLRVYSNVLAALGHGVVGQGKMIPDSFSTDFLSIGNLGINGNQNDFAAGIPKSYKQKLRCTT